MTAEDPAREFLDLRPRLFGIAYRMLGSAWDADDVVAEARSRRLPVDREQGREPAAFLATVVTRLALDRLRSAEAARGRYVGPWLPEPVATGPAAGGPLLTVARDETPSLVLLRISERLSPPERAVLVLHEALAVPHAEIAAVLGVTEEASRQHLDLARWRLADRPRVEPDAGTHDTLVRPLLEALEHGRFGELAALLASDVYAFNDGGGRGHAARRPLVGRPVVVDFFARLRRRLPVHDVRPLEVNGRTAALMTFGHQRRLLGVAVRAGKVKEVYSVTNPDKLSYLYRQLGAGAGATP